MSAVIVCSKCQTENRESARYCRHCGDLLTTNCPRCQAVIPDHFRFCDRCGYALKGEAEPMGDRDYGPVNVTSVRPSLSPVNAQPETGADRASLAQPAAHLERYIPGELLSKLETARRQGGMVGERRVVSILFCDLTQSTSAAGKVDPEEWTEIINGAFEQMIGPVYRYEGTVARLMGDGLLAFFGAPIAHEDDPHRAVLAGLDIVDGIAAYRQEVEQKYPIELNVRVGINTGRVVVGEVGSDMRLEYTAMGDAVNLAARMEQNSEPGTVQISEATYRLVGHDFDVEPLGNVQVKGKDEPVPAYRILRATSRTGRLDQSIVPLVGRQYEMNLLGQTLEDVSNGFGRVICLIGEVGLGKSRLVEELHRIWIDRFDQGARTAEFDPGSVQLADRWFEATSLSYESALPYGLFQNFFRQILGISRNDPPAKVERRLSEFVADLPDDWASATRGVLATMFSLSQDLPGSLEGEEFKNQLFNVVLYLIRRWAGDDPAVMVCDDLHWSDPASVELLLHLFQATDQAPLLLICALRPDRKAPGWQVKVHGESRYAHRYREIILNPLPEDDSDQLVETLLGSPDLPPFTRELIRQRVEGNPLFAEEVIRALIADGALIQASGSLGWSVREQADITIPRSLDSLLMSRVDRLDEESRRILQLAAIMGRSFFYRVLKQVCDEEEALDRQLATLQQSDLIRQIAWQPELEYAFRHTLAQEATYRSILRKRRRELHLQVGLAMESIFAGRLEEHAPILGHHFAEAGESKRALKYFLMAGEVASRLFAHTEAAAHYGRAIDYSDPKDDPAQLIDLYLKRGRVLELSGRYDRAFQNYERLESMARDQESQEMLLASLKAQATAHSAPAASSDPDKVLQLASQALQVAREMGDRVTAVELLSSLMRSHFLSGRFQEGMNYGQQAIAEARRLGLTEHLAFALNDIQHCYRGLGMLEQARKALDEAHQLWKQIGNEPMLADNISGKSRLAYLSGQYAQAQKYSVEAYELSKSIGNLWGQSYSRLGAGEIQFQLGNIAEAIRLMNDCLRTGREAGLIAADAIVKPQLAALYGYLGQVEKGFPLARDTVELTKTKTSYLRPVPFVIMAQLYLAIGNYKAAEENVRQAFETYSLDGSANLSPFLPPLARAEVDLALDNYQRASHDLVEVIAGLQKIGLKAPLTNAHFLRGRALLHLKDLEEAEKHLLEALSLSEELGERVLRWRILGTLAELRREMGDDDEGDELRRGAQQIIRELVAHMPDSEAADSFTARADVQALYAG